jgi:hypothetical protein
MLRIIFDSNKNRHFSQISLNNWHFSPQEDEAVDMFFRWGLRLNTELFKGNGISIPNREHNYLDKLDELFTCIELCEAITINVLRVGDFSLHMKRYAYIIIIFLQITNIHIDLRRIIVEDWLAMPGHDKFKQRAMDILDKWEQLLLNNLDDYCWVRIASSSPLRPSDHLSLSLVYVPKDKRDGECYFLAYKIMIPYFMPYIK